MNTLSTFAKRARRLWFTLIELLVVVAVISVLAAMLLPSLVRARQLATRISCMGNEKQLALGAVLYGEDFDDMLPLGNSKFGGDGRIFSGVIAEKPDVLSGAIYVQEYLGVQLYTNYRKFNGTAIPDLSTYSGNIRFYDDAASRGVLHCPGKNVTDVDWSGYRFTHDYWTAGLGAWNYTYGAGGFSRSIYTRYSRVGAPAPDGSPKLLIGCSTYTAPFTDHRAFMYSKANGHTPSAPKGMNVVAGDGSGEWTTDIYDASGTLAGPRGYYSLRGYVMWASWGAISYSSPSGTNQAPRIASPTGPSQPYFKPADYTAAMDLWGAVQGL